MMPIVYLASMETMAIDINVYYQIFKETLVVHLIFFKLQSKLFSLL